MPYPPLSSERKAFNRIALGNNFSYLVGRIKAIAGQLHETQPVVPCDWVSTLALDRIVNALDEMALALSNADREGCLKARSSINSRREMAATLSSTNAPGVTQTAKDNKREGAKIASYSRRAQRLEREDKLLVDQIVLEAAAVDKAGLKDVAERHRVTVKHLSRWLRRQKTKSAPQS